MLLPPTKPHVEGSLAPDATAVCQVLTDPVDTVTGDPQMFSPDVGSLLYTWYCTVAFVLSVRPLTDVCPEAKLLNDVGS
jgi:hypothetical protein